MSLTFTAIIVGIILGLQGLNKITFLFIILIFLINYLISQTISDFITTPIEKLTNNINEISRGKLDKNLKKSSKISELNDLNNSLNKIIPSIKLAIHKIGVIKNDEISQETFKTKIDLNKKQEEIFDNINGWAWETNPQGIYTFCSTNISNILGYKPEDIIGKSYFDNINSENWKNAKQIFDKSGTDRQRIKNFEKSIYNKQGKTIYTLTNATPFYNENGTLQGFRGIDIDITNEKIYEQKIRELNEELQGIKKEVNKIIDNPEESKKLRIEKEKKEQKIINVRWTEQDIDSILIFDEKANIIDCNDNICKKLGYSKNELLSLNISDLDILDSKEQIINNIYNTKKNGSSTIKTIHKKKDGSAILVNENLQYIQDKKEFKAIIREDIALKNNN